MKIGVITDSFKLPVDGALECAAQLGFHGVQIYATRGQFSPEVLNREERVRYKRKLNTLGLEVSALCGDMGGHGFRIASDNSRRVEMTKRIVDLANELESPVVTTHIGVIPDDPQDPVYTVMLEALTACGAYAVTKGVTLAIETGPESAKTLLGFVEATRGGVGVNLDPANFVMVTDQDPVEAVELLGKHIVHTHAKDGVMLKKTTPKAIYHGFATGGSGGLNVAEFFKETPLGEGSVDFPAYLAALKRSGFDGYLTVERKTGADPQQDIIKARDTVKKFLENL